MGLTGKYPDFLKLRGNGYAIRSMGQHYIMVRKTRTHPFQLCYTFEITLTLYFYSFLCHSLPPFLSLSSLSLPPSLPPPPSFTLPPLLPPSTHYSLAGSLGTPWRTLYVCCTVLEEHFWIISALLPFTVCCMEGEQRWLCNRLPQ